MIPETGRVLGVDPGTVRVGVAITDGAQTVASGLTVLVRGRDRDADRRVLAQLVATEGAVGVVVGLPVSLDGRLGPSARTTLEEVEAFRVLLGPTEVETWDERFTTKTAAQALGAGGRPGRARGRRSRQVIDQVAAAVLLQSWLDGRRQGPRSRRPGR